MNNSNLTNFVYKGNVDVSIKVKDKVIHIASHNESEPYLRKAFAKFLTGHYDDSHDRPENIMLKYRPDDISPWRMYLTMPVLLTGISLSETSSGSGFWVATFTGVIPYDILVSPVIGGMSGQFKIYIRSGYDEEAQEYHELASIPISADDLASITPGTSAIVKWSMLLVDQE